LELGEIHLSREENVQGRSKIWSKGRISSVVLGVAIIAIVVVAGAGVYAFAVLRTSTTSSLQLGGTSDSFTFTGSSPVSIDAGGSSFVNPVMQQWCFGYSNITSARFQLNYEPVGSGAGIQNLFQNTFDFAGSDAPVPPSMLANSSGKTLLQIPETLGGVAIFYNVPEIGNTSLKLTGPILAGIWNESITIWNDPRIAALNPGVPLPAKTIIPVHRSDGSGTTYAFTTYLAKIYPAWNSTVGVGTIVNWPPNELAGKGSGGLAGLVSGTQYTIGYVDTYYAKQNKIDIAMIRNSAGNFELPTLLTVAAAAADFASQLQTNPTVSITNALGPDSYPISTFTYLLVWKDQSDPVKGDAIATFFWYVVHNGQKYGPGFGYPTLPPNIVTIDEGLIREISYKGQPFIR
jgi:phosphate transport system substrate-binding protein